MTETTLALPLTGGCVCGRVRYTLSGAPLLAYACHCHDCQKRSGSAFGLVVVVQTADLDVQGDPAVVRLATPSGREIDHSVCPACQGRVLAKAVAAPEYASLRAGALDRTDWIRPAAQMWVESALPWAIIPDVPQVPQTGFDFYAWGETWRATAPRFVARG